MQRFFINEPVNLRSIYNEAIATQIVVILKYAIAKNDASSIRNKIRARKNRDEAEYQAASAACRKITQDWRDRVNLARRSLPSPDYRLYRDYSMGYTGFITPELYLHHRYFKQTVDMFEIEKAIFSLLTEE